MLPVFFSLFHDENYTYYRMIYFLYPTMRDFYPPRGGSITYSIRYVDTSVGPSTPVRRSVHPHYGIDEATAEQKKKPLIDPARGGY